MSLRREIVDHEHETGQWCRDLATAQRPRIGPCSAVSATQIPEPRTGTPETAQGEYPSVTYEEAA